MKSNDVYELLDKNKNLDSINELVEIQKIEKIFNSYGIKIKCTNVINTLYYRIYELDLTGTSGRSYRITEVEKLKPEISMFFDDVDIIEFKKIKNKSLLGLFMHKKNHEKLLYSIDWSI